MEIKAKPLCDEVLLIVRFEDAHKCNLLEGHLGLYHQENGNDAQGRRYTLKWRVE